MPPDQLPSYEDVMKSKTALPSYDEVMSGSATAPTNDEPGFINEINRRLSGDLGHGHKDSEANAAIQSLGMYSRPVSAVTSAIATPAEAAIEAASGKPTHFTDDVDATLRGNAPSGGTRLQRIGMGKGPSVSDYFKDVPAGSPLDVSARGALGLVTDALATKGGMSLGGAVASKVGRGLYNSYWDKADAVNQAAGKDAGRVADTMRKNQVSGFTEGGVKDKILGALNDTLEKRNSEILTPVEESGSQANLVDPFTELRNKLNKWQTAGREGGDIAKSEAAALFEKRLNDTLDFAGPQTSVEKATILRKAPTASVSASVPFEEGTQDLGVKHIDTPNNPSEAHVWDESGMSSPRQGPYPSGVESKDIPVTAYQTPDMKVSVDPDLVRMAEKTTPRVIVKPGIGIKGTTGLKTSGYNQIGDSAWQDFTRSSEGQELLKDYTSALKGEAERLAEQHQSGLGGKLAETNAEIGDMLTPSNVFDSNALKAAGKHGLTQIDLMSLANPKYFALKQLGKLWGSAAAKTVGGLASENVGNAMSSMSNVAPFLNIITPAQKKKSLIDLQGN